MSDPRVEEVSFGTIYSHNADGVTWGIHDGQFRGGTWKTAPPPDLAASHRVFVAKDGTRRVTACAQGEDRRLFVDALARQLQRAGYLGKRFDASRQQPR